MTCHLFAVCVDASDPLRLARFWAGVLGQEMAGEPRDGIVLVPGDATGFRIRFVPAQEFPSETGKIRLHFDLAPPAGGDQQGEAGRLVSLGATRTGIGPGEVSWVAMADPDGRDFCVLTPR